METTNAHVPGRIDGIPTVIRQPRVENTLATFRGGQVTVTREERIHCLKFVVRDQGRVMSAFDLATGAALFGIFDRADDAMAFAIDRCGWSR